MKKTLILLLVIVLNTTSVFSQQEAMKVINQINKVYASAKTFSTEMEYVLYDGAKPQNIVHTYSGYYIKSGFNYYSKSASVESIFNDKLVIYADHTNKFISVMSSSNKVKMKSKDFMDMFKDTALNQYSKIELKKVDEKISKCVFMMKSNKEGYSRIELLYTSADYHVTSVYIYYQDHFEIDTRYSLSKPVMRVTYKHTQFNKPVTKNTFSTDRFVIVDKKKQVQLTPAYKNYKLLTQ